MLVNQKLQRGGGGMTGGVEKGFSTVTSLVSTVGKSCDSLPSNIFSGIRIVFIMSMPS